MNAPSLDSLLDEILAGHSAAFSIVVRRFGLPLRSYLSSHLHHADDVDDLAQEVFLVAFRDLAKFRRGDDFGAWLRGIARHRLQNYFRSRSRFHGALERFCNEARLIIDDDVEDIARNETSEEIEVLLGCIAKLPERLRRVVRAGLDGQKSAAMAEEMNTTVGAIYNLHYRANRLLRECVERELT